MWSIELLIPLLWIKLHGGIIAKWLVGSQKERFWEFLQNHSLRWNGLFWAGEKRWGRGWRGGRGGGGSIWCIITCLKLWFHASQALLHPQKLHKWQINFRSKSILNNKCNHNCKRHLEAQPQAPPTPKHKSTYNNKNTIHYTHKTYTIIPRHLQT